MSSSIEHTLQAALRTASSAQDQLTASLDPSYEAVRARSLAEGLPPIAVGPSAGASLAILCRLLGARRVLEIGTLGGYSTLFLARSAPGVRVTSIEADPRHRAVALENLARAGVGAGDVDILLGRALDVLPTLEGEGEFDLVFVDADWDNQAEYFDWAVKLARKGGCVYVDNAVRQLTEAAADGSDKGWALIDHVKNDSRVHAALIPTVATHKTNPTELVDGYLIAYVK